MANIPNPIDEYKRRLGQGAKLNLYNVTLTFPTALGVDPDLEDEFSILCDKATFPKPRNIEMIEVPVQGEFYKLAGNKANVEDLNFSFRNDPDHRLRDIFEAWLQLIQTDRVGIRTNFANHVANIQIAQLNEFRDETKKIEVVSAWPNAITEGIEFDNTNGTEISLTNVTIAYDFHRFISVS